MGGLLRAYCRMVGHTGDWSSLDSRCVRERRCRRCGQVTRMKTHSWTDFDYFVRDRCEQERRCQRCMTTESRVLHAWGPWRYVGPDSFQLKLHQVRACGRCGD